MRADAAQSPPVRARLASSAKSRSSRLVITLRSLVDDSSGLPYVAPAFLLFAVFVLYPIGDLLFSSFFTSDGRADGTQFAAFENYGGLLRDANFHIAVRNTMLWLVVTTGVQMGLGFAFAWVLSQKIRGLTVWRAILFAPVIIAPVVVATVWQELLDPFAGFVSAFGRFTGISFLDQAYLGNPDLALYAVMAVSIWSWTGFNMLIYLAGLTGIPGETLEAATVDGANAWRRVFHIVLPMMRPTHLTLALLGIVGSLKTFDLVYVMTRGGPNHASEVLATYIFQQGIVLRNTGYASAVSVVLLILSFGLSLALVRGLGARFALIND